MKNLKITTVILLLLSTSFVTAKTTNWISNYDNALKAARATNKPIIIDFWATWCKPCLKMDDDVWSKNDIQQLLENFIPLKLDIDKETNLARKYKIVAIPYVLVVDGWGNILYEARGYQDKNAINKLLKNFSVNMAMVYPVLANLEKDETNMYSNLRAGQKFQDMALYLNSDAKRGFVNRSNYYLKIAHKYIPKGELKLIEKNALLKDLNKVYLGGSKSFLKKMNKTYKAVNASNEPLYLFVQFVSYQNLNDIEMANEIYTKLKETNSSYYLKKANYLFSKRETL